MNTQMVRSRLSFICLIFGILCALKTGAQTVDDVLEKGILVDDESIILLKVDNEGKLSYEVWPRQKNKYRPLQDNTLFLSTLESANIYLRPLNPLNFSHKAEIKFVVDPIEAAANEAIASITKTLQENVKAGEFKGEKMTDSCNDFKLLLNQLTTLQEDLNRDMKADIVRAFEKLKGLSFAEQVSTIEGLKEVDAEIKRISEHYESITGALNEFNKLIDATTCGNERDIFINKYLFKNLSQEVAKLLNSQKVRLENLKNAYRVVKTTQEEASAENEGDLKWVIRMDPVEIRRGEISEFALSINETGYVLSDAKEIVKMELKEKSKRTLKFRRFQRFVPEVLAGTAYTNLRFPKYGTTTNAAGEEVVADAGTENVRKLNFTTMLNLNYYLRNSNVHPFIQLGIGANVGYPSLLAGAGFRFKFQNIPAFTLAIGGASTWVKELGTLHLGDKVGGIADVEKDTKHSFHSPKIYYGIQLHF